LVGDATELHIFDPRGERDSPAMMPAEASPITNPSVVD
jgi:hypothetical protein